jgi:hypothetical protein
MLRDLYIVSSAAAQLGGFGLEISQLQWGALAERIEAARTVLDREFIQDADTAAALRRLLQICEYIIGLHTAGRRCPPAIWREAARLGREAYGWMHRDVDPEQEAGV